MPGDQQHDALRWILELEAMANNLAFSVEMVWHASAVRPYQDGQPAEAAPPPFDATADTVH